MPKHHAPHPHQRQNSDELACLARHEINALVAEHVSDHGAPLDPVTMRISILGGGETVPSLVAAAQTLNRDHLGCAERRRAIQGRQEGRDRAERELVEQGVKPAGGVGQTTIVSDPIQ